MPFLVPLWRRRTTISLSNLERSSQRMLWSSKTTAWKNSPGWLCGAEPREAQLYMAAIMDTNERTDAKHGIHFLDTDKMSISVTLVIFVNCIYFINLTNHILGLSKILITCSYSLPHPSTLKIFIIVVAAAAADFFFFISWDMLRMPMPNKILEVRFLFEPSKKGKYWTNKSSGHSREMWEELHSTPLGRWRRQSYCALYLASVNKAKEAVSKDSIWGLRCSCKLKEVWSSA